MRCILAITFVFILQHGSGLEVQTEHTIVEEWSWRDNETKGNGDYGGYEYSEQLDNGDGEEDYEEDNNNEEAEALWAQANADAEDEDEESCEYSCPRYYRPVCVLRNGLWTTFATPCEFYNEVRCASVRRRLGQSVPHLQYQHSGEC